MVDKMDEDDTHANEAPEEEIFVDILIQLMRKKHEITSLDTVPDKAKLKAELVDMIKERNMAPYYVHACEALQIPTDATLLANMQQKNAEQLVILNDKISDTEENFGESEVREAMLEKTKFYSEIGDKENCVKMCDATFEKTVALGPKLDLVFTKIRSGFAFNDPKLTRENIDKATELLKQDGDWERRNRLKVYEGLFCIQNRDFKNASKLMLESVSTFSSYELMDYKTCVWYTVLVCLPTLSRADLKKKVIDNSEVLAIVDEIPDIKILASSLYECKYNLFFGALGKVCQLMLQDVFLHTHVNYYYRELRQLAFQQFLQAYQTVSLANMSQSFMITPECLDSQLCTFIASGRLHCKIDKVAGNIETNRGDTKNMNYQKLIKQGDILLNKVQKLSRVVEA